MAAKSKKVIVINLPFEQVVPIVEQALLKIGAKISNSDPSGGKIRAKKGASLKSWGENITISVARSQNGCSVDILSECALPTQVVDWGSNEGNIQKIVQELSRMVERKIAENVVENELLSTGLMCPQCHQIVPDGTKFCPYDGTPIGRSCPKCKANNMPSAQFCTNCGTQL